MRLMWFVPFTDEGLPFISRTGKTSDVTKIKGWKNKFIRSKETSSSNCDGKVCSSCCSCAALLSFSGISIVILITRLTALKPTECTCTDSLFPTDELKALYSSSPPGSQKNLSAFCSNMLDEYLESEAQNITERAAAFSTNPEGSVAYQLPAKSSSYVKTLDSVLKQRNTASKFWAASNRPCPLSHKPPLSSALSSQTGAPAIQQPAPSGSKGTNSVHQK